MLVVPLGHDQTYMPLHAITNETPQFICCPTHVLGQPNTAQLIPNDFHYISCPCHHCPWALGSSGGLPSLLLSLADVSCPDLSNTAYAPFLGGFVFSFSCIYPDKSILGERQFSAKCQWFNILWLQATLNNMNILNLT